jgi:hypothetical protein
MKKSELKSLIREEIKNILKENKTGISLKELSPELLGRAADKAKEQGRFAQSNKFANAAAGQKFAKMQADQEAKYEPVKPFIGKDTFWYYEVPGKGQFKETFDIKQIIIQKNEVLVVYFNISSPKGIESGNRIMFYDPKNDSWGTSNDVDPWWVQGKYSLMGTDMPSAQLLTKIAKAYNPETAINPNTLIKGAATPLLDKHFKGDFK